MGEYVIIGPSKAGKTALLSTLALAADNCAADGSGRVVEVSPRDTPTAELFKVARSAPRTGRLPIDATGSSTKYSFTLTVSGRRFFDSSTTSTFDMLDGPGGALFQEDDGGNVDYEQLQRYRGQFLVALRECKGFVLCISAVDRRTAGLVFSELPGLFDEALKEVAAGRLNAARVAVCMTKADAWAIRQEHGRTAQGRAAAADAVQAAREIIPRGAFRTLASRLLPRAEVAFGLASAYGFIEGEGTANYDQNTGEMLLSVDGNADEVAVFNAWQPFRVLDPFVFLATGRAGSMKVLRASDLLALGS